MGQEVFKELARHREDLLVHLGSGGTLNHSSAESTLANTASVVGEIRGINRLLEMDWADETEEGIEGL